MSGTFGGVNHVQGATTVREIETIVKAAEAGTVDLTELVEAIRGLKLAVAVAAPQISVEPAKVEVKPLVHVDLPTQPPMPAPTVQITIPTNNRILYGFYVFIAVDILIKLWALHGGPR